MRQREREPKLGAVSRPLQDFCWRGHHLHGANVRHKKSGARECWACRRTTWWQGQESLATDRDHRLLSRVYANTHDLLGHDPDTFLLPDDAQRLVDPTKEWLRNEALLVWIAAPECELRAEDVGLENIDVLFLARPGCDRVLLLKPRNPSITRVNRTGGGLLGGQLLRHG